MFSTTCGRVIALDGVASSCNVVVGSAPLEIVQDDNVCCARVIDMRDAWSFNTCRSWAGTVTSWMRMKSSVARWCLLILSVSKDKGMVGSYTVIKAGPVAQSSPSVSLSLSRWNLGAVLKMTQIRYDSALLPQRSDSSLRLTIPGSHARCPIAPKHPEHKTAFRHFNRRWISWEKNRHDIARVEVDMKIPFETNITAHKSSKWFRTILSNFFYFPPQAWRSKMQDSDLVFSRCLV